MSERLGQPAGIPIGRALVVAPGIANDDLRKVLAIIGRFHGDGALPPIPVSFVEHIVGAAGRPVDGAFAYRFDEEGLVVAGSITIRASSPPRQLTVVHEVGHFIDASGLPGAGFSSIAHPVLADWRVAVHHSASYRRWERASSSRDSGLAARATLLIDPTELWARSYAQFVTTRSGDVELRRDLAILQGRRSGSDVYLPRQWSDDEFAAIDLAIERLFRRLTWIGS